MLKKILIGVAIATFVINAVGAEEVREKKQSTTKFISQERDRDIDAEREQRAVYELDNLKKIGLALRVWVDSNNSNKNTFPDDLGVLMDYGYLAECSWCFIRPGSSTPLPENGDDIRKGSCDYFYFGKGVEVGKATNDKPIAVTVPGKLNKSIYVLYADGHVMGWFEEAHIPAEIKVLINEK